AVDGHGRAVDALNHCSHAAIMPESVTPRLHAPGAQWHDACHRALMSGRGAHRMSTPAPGPAVRQMDLDEPRAVRRRAQREEAELSYLRRLLHGRIDILQAERRRRASRNAALLDLAELPRILAD